MREVPPTPPETPRPLSAAAFPALLSPSATRAVRALARRFGVWRFGLEVWCFQNTKPPSQSTVLCFVMCVLDFGSWILGSGSEVVVFGVWCLMFSVWRLVFGVWCLVFGV